MSSKRKLEHFDPNKSDSNDDDYESAAPGRSRSRKSVGKPRSKPKRGAKLKNKRPRYNGSDVEDDDDISDESMLEASFHDDDDEEEPEKTETGRPLRGVVKNAVKYEEEESGSDIEEESATSEDEDVVPSRRQKKPEKIVKLKLTLNKTPVPSARNTRATSMARSAKGASIEPIGTANRARRNTRAHTEEVDEPLVALSNSGRHAVAQGSASPETAVSRAGATRGAKGMKKPETSVILEESHESTSFEQAAHEDHDAMVIETTESAKEEAIEIGDSHEVKDDTQIDSDLDELAGDPIPEAAAEDEDADADDDDDDDMPVSRTRATRGSISQPVANAIEAIPEEEGLPSTGRRLRKRTVPTKAGVEHTSDIEFKPNEESEEDISASDASPRKRRTSSNDSGSTPVRGGRSNRGGKPKSSRKRSGSDGDDDELDQDELLEEAAELKANGRRQVRSRRDPDILYQPIGRRERKHVDYTIKPMDQIYAADEDLEDAAPTVSRGGGRRNAGSQSKWERNLHTTFGPFGGGGGPTPVTGPGPWGTGAAGGADSDSSDDENMARPNAGGNVGMTPTSGMPGGLLPGMGQTNPTDAIAAASGTPANLGRIKSQKDLADADPLGVDQNVDFSKVGGLAGHIDQLKEMVQMPLLYPELFLKFHVTPPRGVLFHGPPGTGKTPLF